MSARFDVAVVGGGPAGLALASFAARRGLSTIVLERRGAPFDKACGEGVLPAGVRALEVLGVREAIERAGAASIEGVRYVVSDASGVDRIAEGRLRAPALGVRRTQLVEVMRARATEDGVVLRDDAPVVRHARRASGVAIETEHGALEASILVAADGLGSRVRRVEGLDRPVRAPRRFGLRRHFRVRPWTSSVEVHLGPGCEAYVTPVARDRVGVALLWDPACIDGRVSFERTRRAFPRLERALEGAVPEGRVLGAGPLARASTRRTVERLALLGDAAGYVDAITGEGISLALGCAAALAAILPDVIARDGARDALAPYERAFARGFRSYAYATRSLLWLARRPRARRLVVDALARAPRVFDAALDAVVG